MMVLMRAKVKWVLPVMLIVNGDPWCDSDGGGDGAGGGGVGDGDGIGQYGDAAGDVTGSGENGCSGDDGNDKDGVVVILRVIKLSVL